MASEILKKALEYSDLGFSVIPAHTIIKDKCSCGNSRCSAPGKHPRVKWQSRMTDPMSNREIRSWWDRYPDSNVGIVTGEISGITVLDVDGEEGMQSLHDAGFDPEDILTPMVRTGGGGAHYYYKYTDESQVYNRAGVLHKVDIRTDGGFVVAPPSLHLSGRKYSWARGRGILDLDLSDMDTSWISSDDDSRGGVHVENETWVSKTLQGVGEGERNDSANKLAWYFSKMGMPRAEILAILVAWNQLNDPPMPHNEMERTVQSASQGSRRESSEDPDVVRERISRALGMSDVPLTHVHRMTGSSPKFLLFFGDDVCHLTVQQLLSPASFQSAIASGTNILPRRLSNKAASTPNHDQVAQQIMEIAEDIDAGAGATSTGEIMTVVEHIASGISEENEVPPDGSFMMDGIAWMSLADVIREAHSKFHWGITIPDTAQRLRMAGMTVKRFSVGDKIREMYGFVNEDV